MKTRFLSTRRFKACAWALAAAAWLAAGCGNNGGAGDGVYDNSIPPGGASGAGRSGNGAGASSRAGAPAAGAPSAGAAGSSSGAGGASAGAAGSAGQSGGAGGPVGGSAGLGAGGSTAGGSNSNCGNGIIEAGEACDSGMPPGTGGAGTAGAGTSGGGGDQSSAGAPSVVAKYGQLCSNTCYNVSTQACLDCEVAGDCYESVDNCLGPVDKPFTAAEQTACYAVVHCIQASNCFDGTNLVSKCYCGTLSLMACGSAPFDLTKAGAPDGACAKEIQTGFPTKTTNSTIIGSFGTADFPSNAATNRLSCQKGASEGACANVCGFTAGGPAFP